MKKAILCFLSLIALERSYGQDMLGLGTGNYSGITGMTLNPASIVDSRLKFDINIIGLSNYYTNNYVLLRRDAFISGDLFRNRYNSYDALKKDLLEANSLDAGERVYARVNNRIQLPLSFMLTTGKKSAIALNISNRTNVMVNNLDQDFAQFAFDRFRNTSLYNHDFNMNGANVALLNWVDIGFTYGRVLMDTRTHFLKGAVTVKYIGAAASGYMKADQLSLRFSDSSTISAQSPYVSYGHSDKIDENLLRAGNINGLKNVSSTAGLDLGLVYEFRGQIDRYEYQSSAYETEARRDKNKYVFRVGASIMDVGRLRFNKGGYNNNFSANINNYDVSGLSIKSIQDLDTALAGHVAFNNDVKNYTVSLPTAFGFQLDLHIFKGFYVNASTYQPFSILQTDQQMEVTASYAITPRFESRVFGFYVPVTYNELDKWNLGATLRLGPLYVGSSNLGSLIVKEKTRTADIHAGFHIPVAFGRSSKLGQFFQRTLRGENTEYNTTVIEQGPVITDKTMDEICDLQNRVTTLENRSANTPANDSVIALKNKRADEIRDMRSRLTALEQVQTSEKAADRATGQPVYLTVNNYGSGTGRVMTTDTLMTGNAMAVSGEADQLRRQLAKSQQELQVLKAAQAGDTTRLINELQQKNREIDSLKRQVAEKDTTLNNMELRLRKIEEQSNDLKKK